MRVQTLGDALVDAGLSREEMELGAAVTKFFKSGGSRTSAHAVVDAAAERMSGRGLPPSVGNDHLPDALTRQPVEDGKTNAAVPVNGPSMSVLRSSFNRGGEGLQDSVRRHQIGHAALVREPSKSQRTVAGLIAKATAITVLDTLKIDGRAIGDWTVAEARAVGVTKTREGRILIEAARMVANAPANALLREVVKADELQIIMQKAAEISDAA